MSESTEQALTVRWFKIQYPKYRLIAIPNGQWIAGQGARKFALINKYKAEGLTNGVSDLLLCVKRGGYGGLWIEMKDKGKTEKAMSDDQRKWFVDMEMAGYRTVCAAGFDEAARAINAYLNG